MELKILMEKTDKKIVKCPECRAFGKDIQKKGLRRNKREEVQKYWCKKCRRYFVNKKMLNKSYPTNVILNAISFYNKGMSLENASKKVNMKFGIKTYPRSKKPYSLPHTKVCGLFVGFLGCSEKSEVAKQLLHPKGCSLISLTLISSWMNEFSNICTFRRVRGEFVCKRGFAFSNPIFEKLIEHKQPYLYKYHKLKIGMFLREYFSGLGDYLFSVAETCPHELFLQDNVRSSQIKINYANSKLIGVEKKNNYACRLAELALKMARTNRERHEIVQDFMLSNDTSTIAVEVPIWLTSEEVDKLNSEFGVFPELSGHDKNKKDDGKDCGKDDGKDDGKSSDEGRIMGREITGGEITGHIDIIQARFGLIYVLDYKPEAERVDAVEQLFTYALALSIRTNVWLRNFKCAWFDEKGYYEFNPNDIILTHVARKFGKGKIPEKYIQKYVLNEGARSYYTGSRFHALRADRDDKKKEQESENKLNGGKI